MPHSIKPRFSAHRGDTDESWRMLRLAEAWTWVDTAENRRGGGAPWEGAVVAMYDREGDLTVTFRSLWDIHWFLVDMRNAWRSVDQFTPLHVRVNLRAPDPRRALRSVRSRTKPSKPRIGPKRLLGQH